jgi:hypothetical protein
MDRPYNNTFWFRWSNIGIDGKVLLSSEEHTEQEQQRSERMIAKLREQGIAPDSME